MQKNSNDNGKVYFRCYREKESLMPYLIMLAVCAIGFVSPIEVKKPGMTGKICLILVGILEIIGVFFPGWDLV